MKELSLHILDVAENGISAGADFVRIEVDEACAENRFTIIITDNGRGISDDILSGVTNPFYTTRTTRRVGLGLSLLESAARRCDGSMCIESAPGKGTRIIAEFKYDHIDRAPLGDIVGTMTTLIMGNPDVDFKYCHQIDGKQFSVNTRDVKEESGSRFVTDAAFFQLLYKKLHNGLNQLKSGEI
ncbi:MAG: ATP-binding protein [Dissulfuribacterales bacterium]